MSWHIPARPEGVEVTPQTAGWSYSGLRVTSLAASSPSSPTFTGHTGEPPSTLTFTGHTGEDEVVVLPLAGGCVVTSDAGTATLTGRAGVFAGVTDCVYLPRDTSYTLTSPHGGRFALASARARKRMPFRYIAASDVRVELRGAGACSRQVNNFGTPDVLDADRLIACEVLTPAGNWSSYPPHKHDTDRPGESVLEEIYYFEVAAGPAGPGVAYQRVYGSPGFPPADVLAEVRTGDVVTIPYGWHGPSMAVPGYDLYYLNVMAGPGKREWLICDDPAHAWVRSQWRDQPVDPRLPFRRS